MKAKILRKILWGSLLAAAGLGISTTSSGQEAATVQGVVRGPDQQPLIGATIVVKGGTGNALTDNNGRFSIQAATGDSLVVSYIGYESETVAVSGHSNLTIMLHPKVTTMQDVIVTALGIKKQTRALTYSTQEITGNEITAVKDPSGNIMNSLSGKVANLVVTPAGAGPGGAARIVLRGNRSINGNNNALVVVDGVPIDNTMSTERAGGGSANTLGTQIKSISSGYSGMDGASSINPDDVESITVLKGPAAAALYGSRAANGALIITTKSGKSGKTTVNYNMGFSTDIPYLLNDFQNVYGRGNGGAYGANAAQSWGAKTKTYPGNVKSFYRNGILLDNSIDASGGTDKLQGYVSYTNNLTNGIIPENDLHRDNFNLRLTAQVIPRLTADAKITYLNQKVSHLPRLGDQGINNEAYIMPRDLSPDSLKIYEKTDPITGQPMPVYWANSSIFQNPYWDVYRMNVTQSRDRIMLLGSLKYEFTDWLSLQGRYSLDKYDDLLTGSYYNNTTLNPFNPPGGRYQESNINHWERNMDLLLSGNNDLGADLNISYNIGAAILDIRGGNTATLANGLSIANKFNFNFASNLAVTSVPVEKEIQSVYGNVQFDYRHFLYLDASLRNDWSSTLPPPYSYAYPSVGLSAVLSSMMQMPDWIYFAKIRAAYTDVGNDADPYQLAQRYVYGLGAGNGFVSRDNTKSINDLKPEKTRSYEIGLDWKFFGGRLGLDATYYKNNTINQLVLIGLPQASGYSLQYVNVGNIENKGLELVLTANPVHGNTVDWSTNVNFALNRNKIIALKEGITQTTLSSSTNFGQLIIKPGGSYGDIYGYGWAKDEKTGQFLIDNNGLPVATPAKDQKLGNFNPDYTLGWSNRIDFKRFFVLFQIDGRIGGIVVSGTDALQTNFGVSQVTTRFREGGLVLSGVHADGTPNTTEITAEKLWTTVSNGGRSSGFDEFFAFDATNFRLRELSIGYDFNLHSRVINNMRLSLTGRNLFFLYRGKSVLDIPGIGKRKLPVDPEYAIGTSNYQGIESGLPPALRSFGLNLHVSF